MYGKEFFHLYPNVYYCFFVTVFLI
ncbi:MAG: hypothetical protein U0T78_09405 [Cloacibacterium normanense]